MVAWLQLEAQALEAQTVPIHPVVLHLEPRSQPNPLGQEDLGASRVMSPKVWAGKPVGLWWLGPSVSGDTE